MEGIDGDKNEGNDDVPLSNIGDTKPNATSVVLEEKDNNNSEMPAEEPDWDGSDGDDEQNYTGLDEEETGEEGNCEKDNKVDGGTEKKSTSRRVYKKKQIIILRSTETEDVMLSVETISIPLFLSVLLLT